MGPIVIFSFILLGIAAFVIQKKKRFQQIDLLHLLFIGALSLMFKMDFDDAQAANIWSYSLIGVLALNFLLSRWTKVRKPIVRLLPPIVSFGVLFGIFWNDSFIYLGENFNISDKATLVLPLIGIVMYEVAKVKIDFLQKYFGMKDSAVNVQMSFFVGVAVLIGAFNAQGYGVFLVAIGFAASSFYHEIGSKHILHSLLAVAMLWTFANENSIDLIDLRFPKVVGGLFIGAFSATFIQHIWTIEKRQNLALFICYAICALLFVGMLDFESRINASFGGVEAFLGGLIGYALANTVLYFGSREKNIQQAPAAMSGLALIIVIGIFVPPLLVNEEEQKVLEEIEAIAPKAEDGKEIEVPYIAMDDLSGKHNIVTESALVSFKLGPDGSVTKGAIKEFSGYFNFGEDIANTSFEVKMPVLNLTTFIPMRDKSIMGEDYFNQEKFPSMRFSGSQMTPTEKENEFELSGTFEMLGQKSDQKVLVHRIEEDGKVVLVGSGEIDRRKHGMADDPREGNIVSFDFKVELQK